MADEVLVTAATYSFTVVLTILRSNFRLLIVARDVCIMAHSGSLVHLVLVRLRRHIFNIDQILSRLNVELILLTNLLLVKSIVARLAGRSRRLNLSLVLLLFLFEIVHHGVALRCLIVGAQHFIKAFLNVIILAVLIYFSWAFTPLSNEFDSFTCTRLGTWRCLRARCNGIVAFDQLGLGLRLLGQCPTDLEAHVTSMILRASVAIFSQDRYDATQGMIVVDGGHLAAEVKLRAILIQC